MDIEIIRERVRAGNYLVKSHAIQHALKEGFDRSHMVEALLNGIVIEDYPQVQRVLICGRTTIAETTPIYLYVVCEYSDQTYAELVTAYVPDEREWESPPFRRRRRRRN